MERNRQHLEDDPLLRRPFIEQESLAEFRDRAYPGIVTTRFDDYCAERGLDPERLRSHVENLWKENIDRETSLNEYLYLKGMTDKVQRWAHIDQIHAELREGAVKKGIIPREDAGEVCDSDLPEL